MSFPRHRRHHDSAMPTAPGHEVRIQDGRFAAAVCTCGWVGAGRRNRATAREEAHDHALLYADGSELSVEPLGAAEAAVPDDDRADA